MSYKALQATLERRVATVYDSKKFPLMAGRVRFLWSAIAWAKQGVRHFTYRASYFFLPFFFSWSGHLLITIHSWVLLFFSDEKTNSGDFYCFHSKLRWRSFTKKTALDATRTIRWVWASKPPLKTRGERDPALPRRHSSPGRRSGCLRRHGRPPSESTVHGLFGATVNYLNTRW